MLITIPKTEKEIKEILYSVKWGEGYFCKKCNGAKEIKPKSEFSKRCAACKYEETVTAHTVFNRLRIDLTVAFEIVHRLYFSDERLSSNLTFVIRKHNQKATLRQKTIYDFLSRVYSAVERPDILLNDCIMVCFKFGSCYICGTEGFSQGMVRYTGIVSKSLNEKVIQKFISEKMNDLSNLTIYKEDKDGSLHPYRQDIAISNSKSYFNPDLLLRSARKWISGIHNSNPNLYKIQSYLNMFFVKKNKITYHDFLKMLAIKRSFDLS